ncbi:MAG: HAD-IC family P-type ATPase, partial [Propionibacterium sp.]|nr:HAD-IC family P-type ATPase [Propionibacterium sp.]
MVDEYGTGADGLTSSRAAELLESLGPNELRQKPPVPLWRRVLQQFQDPLVYLLFVAMGISLAAWIFEGAGGAPIDVIVIAAIVIANAIIGLVQEGRAESAVAALSKMTAATSSVLRDGELTSVPSSELVPGDVLVLAEGDAVGADARLVTATGLRVQEASLTGESAAAAKDPATLAATASIGDRHNMVHKGTAVVQGVGRAVVTATGMDTEIGAIADMLETTEEDPSPLTKEITKVSKMLGLFVIGIAVVTMGALFLLNDVSTLDEAVQVLLLGVSLAVAAVPEGLPAILSLVLAIGVQALAKRNAVMKDLYSVETLGSASVIASDKTGTLTRNEMTLKRIVTASGEVLLGGTGYDPQGGVENAPDDATLAEARVVLGGGSIANNAQLGREDDVWQILGDPTEGAFLVAQHKFDGVAERVGAFERHAEVPFTSDRKMMSVAGHDVGVEREVLYTKGAPDVLLGRCRAERVGGEAVGLTDERRSAIDADITRLSNDGYRTLGVAYRGLERPVDELGEEVESELVFAGVVGIIDPPREEAARAIAEAQRAGIRTLMITGDHPGTAASIASDLGIVDDDAPVLTGAGIDALSEDEFRAATREVNVYARVAPEHKLRIVDALQDEGH